MHWQTEFREWFAGGSRHQYLILKPTAAVHAHLAADRDAESEAVAIAESAVQAITAQSDVPCEDGLTPCEFNFGYRISGESGFAPRRIYDDGTKNIR